MAFSPRIQKLAETYSKWRQEAQAQGTGETIAVDQVAAKVASFYEAIRGVVDWREEHLLRKTAIGRILKRRLFVSQRTDAFAETFLEELVRGGHFPNASIPKAVIAEVQHLVAKYLFLVDHVPATLSKAARAGLTRWLVDLAASEIEELLAPATRERALIDFMAEKMNGELTLRNGAALSLDEQYTQVYIAVHRALFKLDDPTITQHLFERLQPGWKQATPETLRAVAERLPAFAAELQKLLTHPLAEKFYQLAEKHDTPFLLIGDVLSKHTTGLSAFEENPQALENAIQAAYEIRLEKLKGKIGRAALYSTVSVFLSKIVIALAIEIPYDTYIAQGFSVTILGLSIAIPTACMFLLVATTKTSSGENLQRVLLHIMSIVKDGEARSRYEIVFPKKRGALLAAVVQGMYLVSFVLSFGTLVLLLSWLEFSPLSMLVFLLFLSLVAFAGTKIRQRARELMVGEQDISFAHTVFDFFSLPLIQVGKWLSRQVTRFNVLVIFFNFLIEIPFQVFVEFLEQWRSFLKEKREEVH